MGSKIIEIRKYFTEALANKKGAEMVEGAISLPVIILIAMLLLRTFTFYLEILGTAVSEHTEALRRWDTYSGVGMKVYRTNKEVNLLRGGILLFDAKKVIETEIYMINEDLMVRADAAFK